MKDFRWVEKYRPTTVDECILPESVKNTFKSFLEQGEIPNLLLSGTAGVGKTTIAKALCNELGADFYVINGSDEGRFLDTVRNQGSTQRPKWPILRGRATRSFSSCFSSDVGPKSNAKLTVNAGKVLSPLALS